MNESFRKWWNDNASEINKRYEDGTLHEFIYTSALLGAAEIADNEANGFRNTIIAAAIRKEAGE